MRVCMGLSELATNDFQTIFVVKIVASLLDCKLIVLTFYTDFALTFSANIARAIL
jgi:hypothetical protein